MISSLHITDDAERQQSCSSAATSSLHRETGTAADDRRTASTSAGSGGSAASTSDPQPYASPADGASLVNHATLPGSADGVPTPLSSDPVDTPPHTSLGDKGKRRASSPPPPPPLPPRDVSEQVLPAAALPDDSSRYDELYYRQYRNEREDLAYIMRLVDQELSEPYNIYTFRYFLIEWPHLAFLVYPSPRHTVPIGTVLCKQDSHKGRTNRGYIAMLSVERAWRRRGIATRLVRLAIDEMTRRGAHEIVLETEYDNETSLALYGALGFLREKRLHRFYSNGKDAFRLILPLPNHPCLEEESDEEADYARWMAGSGPEWLDGLQEEEAVHRGLGGPPPLGVPKMRLRPPPIPPPPMALPARSDMAGSEPHFEEEGGADAELRHRYENGLGPPQDLESGETSGDRYGGASGENHRVARPDTPLPKPSKGGMDGGSRTWERMYL